MRPPHDHPDGRQTHDLASRYGADRCLQTEIDKALAELAKGFASPLGLRLARVLTTVLAPSWSEHASFQEEALFPILAKAGDATAATRLLLVRLGREHVEIGERQQEAISVLNDVAGGRAVAGGKLGVCLAGVAALRRRHYDAEAVLEPIIPTALEGPDRVVLARWTADRGGQPFPLNLILESWE
jgi:hypothetical protein